MNEPLRCLVLSDGRPGHYHLAEGVAAAIARLRPVAVRKVEISRRRAAPGRLLAGLVTRRTSPGIVLRLGYGLAPASLPPADLVLSAGGDTLAATVAAAQHLGAESIYCGTLKRVPADRLSLIVTSYRRFADRPRHLAALKPNGIDPDTLGTSQREATGHDEPPRLAALLVGGNSGFFHYESEDWRRLLAFLSASTREHGTRWLVSTSRRTPDPVADELVALARAPDTPIAELIDFRTAGPGTLPRVLGPAGAVLCTEDSSTMISEAVCARLPVVGVSPVRHAFKDEEREYRELMLAQGWCRFVPLADLTPAGWLAALGEIRPLAENHLDRLAAELRRRLPQLFP